MDTKYQFGAESNAYFNGHDGHVTRKEDGNSVRIRFSERRNLLAVNVKDYELLSCGMSDETRDKLDDLMQTYGDEFANGIYEGAQEQWWSDAEWLTTEDPERPDWTNGVYQEGRSGGWCVIMGTERLAEDFQTGEYEDQDIENEDLTEYKQIMHQMREEFCDLAFILVDMIVGMREGYMTERINDEYDELTERRESAIVLGYN